MRSVMALHAAPTFSPKVSAITFAIWWQITSSSIANNIGRSLNTCNFNSTKIKNTRCKIWKQLKTHVRLCIVYCHFLWSFSWMTDITINICISICTLNFSASPCKQYTAEQHKRRPLVVNVSFIYPFNKCFSLLNKIPCLL